MRVTIRHTPTFGVARVVLAPGERVHAAAKTLVASSFGVVESRSSRSDSRISNESNTIFNAPEQGGWVDLAPTHSGDVYPLELDGNTGWCVAKGAILAQPDTVHRDAPWPQLQALFGGDTGFLEHYGGLGVLVVACAGPVDAFTIEQGEIITVMPAFLLAYPDSVQCRLRAVDPAGPQSVATGEGLAMDFAGPGTVLVQSRAR